MRPRNLIILIASCVSTGLFVAACSSSTHATSNAPGAGPAFGTANGEPVNPQSAPRAAAPVAGAARAPSTDVTDLAKLSSQSIIYTANLKLRVKDVAATATEATEDVTAVGGYVANEQDFGPTRDSAGEVILQLKIPVASYHQTLATITKLGAQLAFTEQAQDVTQQVADVSSRAASAQAAIKQLRELLSRAGSIPSLLTVQDEINSEEASLESLLAQQTALAHESSYATVTVTFVGHHHAQVVKKKKPKKVHRGLIAGLDTGWRGLKLVVIWLLTAIGTLLPFAVPVVAIGAVLYYFGRRRLVLRRTPPAAAPPATS
jgi:Domain of unknown function (DUF4349)